MYEADLAVTGILYFNLNGIDAINKSLALIIFVVSEKKAFEHFPIGSNVNIFPAVEAILDFRSA